MKHTLKKTLAEVQATTFNELVKFGTQNSEAPYFEFKWNGVTITHHHDECYLVSKDKKYISFEPWQILLINGESIISTLPKEDFNDQYILL